MILDDKQFRVLVAATIAGGIASKVTDATDTSNDRGRSNVTKRSLALADELIALADKTPPGEVKP